MSRDPRKEDMEHSEKVLTKRADEARMFREKIRCFIKRYNKSYWEEGSDYHEKILTQWHTKEGKPSGSIYHDHIHKLDIMFSTYKTIDFINHINKNI